MAGMACVVAGRGPAAPAPGGTRPERKPSGPSRVPRPIAGVAGALRPMLLLPALLLGALLPGGCAPVDSSDPRVACGREANQDPAVRSLQLQVLGNGPGGGLLQSRLDEARAYAVRRCLHRHGIGGLGGVAPPPKRIGEF